ncbi:MAG: hypothetical protein CO094_11010 [Anaerolineae bacterium CG_4_9_14_3_um_filter_57_17]|nr:hypothetical protein [bacterium]NCT20448.1 hypothetical protein [bacterium]OIO83970.1 MAG: hypothetical protein AUK01_10840 [Anaerolineae bacterium CG2_30_57_67]PJB65082.1 MAG: hypothetical protein CO094_11010 [Anaerolineae bacterium CG_4_9_14_3_um_filter_57_17]
MTLLLAFLLWLPKVGLGLTAAHWLWQEKSPAAGLKFFVAIPLGLGISSLFFFAWLWLGLPAKLYPPLEALAAALLLFFTFRLPLSAFRFSPFPKKFIIHYSAFCIALAIAVFFFFRRALQFSHGYEDAWFIWNMAARFLYRAADWTLRFTSQSALWHPDYPLLIPLNVAQGWFALGETTRVPLTMAALFTFAIPGLIFSALRFSGQKVHALSAASLLLLTPAFLEYGTQQMADIPLAAYFLGAAIFLWLFAQTGNLRLLIFNGLLAGFGAWTKNEGWLFWAACLLICIILARQQKPPAFFLLGSLPPLTAALAFKVFLAPANDLFVENSSRWQHLLDPARYGQILAAFAQQIGAFGGWRLGIFGVLLVYALLMGFRRSALRQTAWLWLLIFIQLAGYFAIYLITPHDLAWHLRTSLARLLMQIFPLAVFALFASLKDVEA